MVNNKLWLINGSLHYGWAQIGIKAYDQNDPSS